VGAKQGKLSATGLGKICRTANRSLSMALLVIHSRHAVGSSTTISNKESMGHNRGSRPMPVRKMANGFRPQEFSLAQAFTPCRYPHFWSQYHGNREDFDP